MYAKSAAVTAAAAAALASEEQLSGITWPGSDGAEDAGVSSAVCGGGWCTMILIEATDGVEVVDELLVLEPSPTPSTRFNRLPFETTNKLNF